MAERESGSEHARRRDPLPEAERPAPQDPGSRDDARTQERPRIPGEVPQYPSRRRRRGK